MTVTSNADAYQAVLPGGAVTFTQTFWSYVNSGVPVTVTGVTVTITPAAGGSPVLGPTGTGVTSADSSTFSYQWACPAATPPGDYQVTFSGTAGSGPLSYSQAVTVAAAPDPFPSPGTYATWQQYQQWSGDTQTPTPQVRTTLRRASEIIDRTMIGAVYAVDTSSMPTDPGVIDVLMRATCAQCQFMLANNDLANVKSQYALTSSGGMPVSRAKSAQGQAFPPLAPQAAAILQVAGALPGAPLLGW